MKDGIIYTYRYLFKFIDEDGKPQLRFKLFSDLKPAIETFEKALLNIDGIVSLVREYVCEYDPQFVGCVDVLKKEEVVQS